MAQRKVDPRKILRGYDGYLYHDGDLLAEVNEYNAQISVTNTDWQPVGSRIIVGVTTGYSVSLTFTEVVVRDAHLLKKLLDHVTGTGELDFEFVGKLEGHDEDDEVFVYRACEPDGTIDLQNVTSGDLVRRAWSFRVNEPPDLQEYLGES